MLVNKTLALLIGLVYLPLPALAENPSPAETTAEMPASNHVKKIVLGSGCFWGAEKGYEALPGVIDAVSGYADGSKNIKPAYSEITKYKYKFDPENYAEVVEVRYNSEILSTETLLKHFFEEHDPTQKNRQGNDVGTQYRSIILYTDEAQHQVAINLRDQYQALLSKAGYSAIVTEIKPLQQFNPAEEYHQDYLAKNPNGYCPNHATGITFEQHSSTKIDNSSLLTGKQILVLEADHCPFCERFKLDVAKGYHGSIPMTFRRAPELDGLSLKTPTWATPTIYFLDNGKEVLGHQGYMSAQEFYKALGHFKHGES